jgi:hypothetical protein
LAVTEAQHVIAPADHQSAPHADERGPVVVVEDVEQSAVQHGVECFAERGQVQGIPHEKATSQTSVVGLSSGAGDGG